MTIKFRLITTDENTKDITVFVNGEMYVADSNHNPHFSQIVEKVMADDESVVDLFDLEKTVTKKFDRLSERVTVKDGNIYFDGSVVHDALSDQVLRYLEEGVEKWDGLVAFWEKLASNPNEHSREQLYTWLQNRSFQISKSGNIVAFKGVKLGKDGTYLSIHAGPAIVDDVEMTGYIPNAVGSIVEMPRENVQFNSSIGCASGLHAGTYEYATSFAQGAVLTVSINPRDVVSVPSDCNAQKLRVSRYKVVNATAVEWNGVETELDDDYDVDVESDEDEDYDDDDLCWCGDPDCV